MKCEMGAAGPCINEIEGGRFFLSDFPFRARGRGDGDQGGKHQDSPCPRQGCRGPGFSPKSPIHQINHPSTNAFGHHWARFIKPGLADLPYRPAESPMDSSWLQSPPQFSRRPILKAHRTQINTSKNKTNHDRQRS